MKFEKIYDKTLNEILYKGKHKSGLTVYVLPKPDHSKSYAAFATKYGSIDSEFIPAGEKEPAVVPDGIAHFLEHKLFEQPDDTNVFDEYSKTGASANAYTSFNTTVYLFSSTDKFYENLAILLDFVAKPYFTDENVNKEQGIIGQEIRMYDDDPNWRVFFNMLDALYVNHPIKKDIAGTVESISKIDKDILYKCYNTFYNPSNMILFTCGNVETDMVSEMVDKYVLANANEKIKRFYPEEPLNINKPLVEQSLSVATPLFSIGFKDNDVGYDGDKLLKKEILTSILLEMITGEASELYNAMYDEGLINDSFDAAFEGEHGYAFSSMSGESTNPKLVKDKILDAMSKMVLDKDEFERAKKVEQGKFLRLWNSVDRLSNSMISFLFRNIDIFKFSEICEGLTFEEADERFKSHFKAENCVLSIINPY